jgi:hypothetical protein
VIEPEFSELEVRTSYDGALTGDLGFVFINRHYYKVEPLFRAILIIVDNPTMDAKTQKYVQFAQESRLVSALRSVLNLSGRPVVM